MSMRVLSLWLANHCQTRRPGTEEVRTTVRKSLFFALAALVLASAPAFAYVIKLKDGSLIFARTKYTVKGDRAIITLENGTVTAMKLDQIDVQGSEQYNKENFGNVIAIDTPDSRKPTAVARDHPVSPRIQDYIKENKPRMELPRPERPKSNGDASGPVLRHRGPEPPDGVLAGLRRRRHHAVQADELPREDWSPRHGQHRGGRLQRAQRRGPRAVESDEPRRRRRRSRS